MSVLYIPGFREPPTHKKEPWVKIEEICARNWTAFSRFKLPWDWKWLFSMTEMRKKVWRALQGIEEDSTVVTYSLSSIPVAESILSCRDEIAVRIWKVIFLHPAQDPVYSVSVMDAILSDLKALHWTEYYLHWNRKEIFNTLIWDWEWNADTFQQDLLYYSRVSAIRRDYFQQLATRIWTRGFKTHVEIITWSDDRVVTRWEINLSNRRNLAQLKTSHIPKIWDEILM